LTKQSHLLGSQVVQSVNDVIVFAVIDILYYLKAASRGTAVSQWLRYCATNQKVTGSIPVGVMEFFIDINPSDRTPSTRSISWE
jgi:hypothetical protein